MVIWSFLVWWAILTTIFSGALVWQNRRLQQYNDKLFLRLRECDEEDTLAQILMEQLEGKEGVPTGSLSEKDPYLALTTNETGAPIECPVGTRPVETWQFGLTGWKWKCAGLEDFQAKDLEKTGQLLGDLAKGVSRAALNMGMTGRISFDEAQKAIQRIEEFYTGQTKEVETAQYRAGDHKSQADQRVSINIGNSEGTLGKFEENTGKRLDTLWTTMVKNHANQGTALTNIQTKMNTLESKVVTMQGQIDQVPAHTVNRFQDLKVGEKRVDELETTINNQFTTMGAEVGDGIAQTKEAFKEACGSCASEVRENTEQLQKAEGRIEDEVRLLNSTVRETSNSTLTRLENLEGQGHQQRSDQQEGFEQVSHQVEEVHKIVRETTGPKIQVGPENFGNFTEELWNSTKKEVLQKARGMWQEGLKGLLRHLVPEGWLKWFTWATWTAGAAAAWAFLISFARTSVETINNTLEVLKLVIFSQGGRVGVLWIIGLSITLANAEWDWDKDLHLYVVTTLCWAFLMERVLEMSWRKFWEGLWHRVWRRGTPQDPGHPATEDGPDAPQGEQEPPGFPGRIQRAGGPRGSER